MRRLAKHDLCAFRTYYFILVSWLRIATTKDVIPRNAIGLSIGIFLAPLSFLSSKETNLQCLGEKIDNTRGRERKSVSRQKKNSLLKILRPLFTFENMEIAWKL